MTPVLFHIHLFIFRNPKIPKAKVRVIGSESEQQVPLVTPAEINSYWKQKYAFKEISIKKFRYKNCKFFACYSHFRNCFHVRMDFVIIVESYLSNVSIHWLNFQLPFSSVGFLQVICYFSIVIGSLQYLKTRKKSGVTHTLSNDFIFQWINILSNISMYFIFRSWGDKRKWERKRHQDYMQKLIQKTKEQKAAAIKENNSSNGKMEISTDQPIIDASNPNASNTETQEEVEKTQVKNAFVFDPHRLLKTSRDHYFHTCCPSVRGNHYKSL